MTGVDFASATLIRLAEPATRAGLFGTAALRHVLAAAYDNEPDELGDPPFTPAFDELRLGFAEPHLVGVTGGWAVAGTPSTDVRLAVDGLDRSAGTRVDAFWRGTVTARLPGTLAPVDTVRTVAPAWPDLATLDAEIAAGGGLPADPGAREAARRARLAARLGERLDDPASLAGGRGEAVVAGWLRDAGTESVADLLTRPGRQGAAIQLRYAAAAPAPERPTPYPVAVALLIRDAGLSLPDLLAESKALAGRLERLGLARPAEAGPRVRAPVVVAWLVPAAVFDDPDWPGADPDARITAAGRWLAREGVALVPV